MTDKISKGFSIVELMVAITIGLLLVAGASTVWVSSKVNFGIQSDLADIQEAGRFATTWLQRNIREAGFMGCAGTNDPTILINQVSDADVASNLKNLTNLVEGREKGSTTWQAADTNWLPSAEANLDDTIASLTGDGQIQNGTDAFTIRGFSFDGYGVVDAVTPATRSFDLDSDAGFSANQIVAVINCAGGTVFQLNADMTDETLTIKASDSLSRESDAEHVDGSGASLSPRRFPTYLYAYTAYRYYIRPYHATTNPNGPSLWRVSLNNLATPINEEALPGVDNMQVLYGENTGGSSSPNVYRTAANVSDWSAVTSIKIGLLIRSLNEYGTDTDTSTYQVLDETIAAANDRRRRKVFMTEIAIRNKQ